MSDLTRVLKSPKFKWLPKHLNHIAENIVFKRRNISFLELMRFSNNKKRMKSNKIKAVL
jgi:hypothetical protein